MSNKKSTFQVYATSVYLGLISQCHIIARFQFLHYCASSLTLSKFYLSRVLGWHCNACHILLYSPMEHVLVDQYNQSLLVFDIKSIQMLYQLNQAWLARKPRSSISLSVYALFKISSTSLLSPLGSVFSNISVSHTS